MAGTITGSITVAWRIPSFIVSLGVLEMARGVAYQMTGSRTAYIGDSFAWLSNPIAFGISPSFIIALLVIIIAQAVLTRTVFGRYLIGIGTNEEAVRLAGINPKPYKILVFSLMGLLAGVAALFQISRLEAADPNAGSGLELQVIAAVVIGGTSLMGGRGSVISTFFGVLIISVLAAGLAQIGATEPTKRIITGAVIVIAVVLDTYRSQRAQSAGLSHGNDQRCGGACGNFLHHCVPCGEQDPPSQRSRYGSKSRRRSSSSTMCPVPSRAR